jgi:amino acid transporter
VSTPGAEPRRGERADETARAGGEARPNAGAERDDAPPAAGDEAPPGEDLTADERRVSQPQVVQSDAGGMSRGYARSRARTEAIQAQLEPLGPDERPLGLKLAVGLALLVCVSNLVGAAAGVGGESPALGVVFAVFMGALAVGMWQRRYLAILLFQSLLAITIIIATLSLAVAGNLVAVLIVVGLIVVCAPVFWLLVRVMARLQVPQR